MNSGDARKSLEIKRGSCCLHSNIPGHLEETDRCSELHGTFLIMTVANEKGNNELSYVPGSVESSLNV